MAGEVVGAIERALAVAAPVLRSWGFRNWGGRHGEWNGGKMGRGTRTIQTGVFLRWMLVLPHRIPEKWRRRASPNC